MASDEITFGCQKWADCSCGMTGTCGCGDKCGCGSLPLADVQRAMAEDCPLSDCTCNPSCTCDKNACKCGSIRKTKMQWIEHVKAKTAKACSS